MQIIYNEQWQKDIDTIINMIIPELSEINGRTVMITGATGLICSALIDVLIRYNETCDGRIYIIAAGRNQKKVKERFGGFSDANYFTFVPYDATKPDNNLTISCDYIIHGAGNAFPRKIIEEPVETMLGNFFGIKELLDYSRQKKVKRLLYISSSEVYGEKDSNQPFREENYGFINILNPRSSYPVGKRAAETLCTAYAEEYGIETVIVRPGHIYGPTASQNDNRVASIWAYATAQGQDIVMKSDGSQVRSYCYCLDCATAIIMVLTKGEKNQAYNISNPDSVISIKSMAEILAKTANVNLVRDIPDEKEKKGFNPMNNSSLDSTKLRELGWEGRFNAEQGFSHTVSILSEVLGNI